MDHALLRQATAQPTISFDTVNLSQKSSAPTIKIDIGEFSRPLIFMLDTEASVNLVKTSEVSPYVNIDTDHIIILKGITTHAIKTLGRVRVDFNNYKIDFHLITDDFSITEAGILGTEFFREWYTNKLSEELFGI